MSKILIIFLLFNIAFSVYSQHWQSLNSGCSYHTRCLYNDTTGSLLYVSGHFKYADSILVNGIATWNSASWDSVGLGISYCNSNCFAYWDILRYHGYIYAAGYPHILLSPGTDLVSIISRWDGYTWESADGNTYNDCHANCLFVYNDKLLVGGCFDSIAGIEAHQVAVWNDTIWSNMDSTDFDGDFRVFIEYKNELYGGGNFDTQSGLHEIARWNGTNWYPVGDGIYGNAWVNCFAIYHDELYVGGYFDKSSGNTGDYIQKWDGNNWHEVGGGMWMGQVLDMAVYNDELWAVGQFYKAGNAPAKYIAKWDGNKWCGIGSNLDNIPLQICVYNNELYIGGGFKTIDGDTVNYIAKWIGGNYVDTCSTVGINEFNVETETLHIFPNPANTELHIELKDVVSYSYSITLFDLHGQPLLSKTTNNPEPVLDISRLPAGVYCVKVTGNNFVRSERIIKIN